MKKVHTHYDNLRVTRNAPAAVIKAAYRTLSQQYHPDICANPDATRIMGILNNSYAVLSDPAKRAAHDNWIERQEETPRNNQVDEQLWAQAQAAAHATAQARSQARTHSQAYARTQNQTGSQEKPSAGRTASGQRSSRQAGQERANRKLPETIYFWPMIFGFLKSIPRLYWSSLLIIAGLVWWDGTKKTTQALDFPRPIVEQIPSSNPADNSVRNTSDRAPSGGYWPTIASYLDNFPIGATGGYSTLTIDNSNNNFDVYVKLADVAAPHLSATRHVFIPRHASFTMADVAEGRYELRYKNLTSGSAAKTTPFELEEIRTVEGIQFSQVTFTLYTVQNGNARMKPIRDDEF